MDRHHFAHYAIATLLAVMIALLAWSLRKEDAAIDTVAASHPFFGESR